MHTYSEYSVACNRVHGIHAVADEIDENLLNLDAIERDRRKVAFDLDIHPNAAPRRFLGHEVMRLGDDAVDRCARPRLHGVLEQGADVAHDIGGGIGVMDDALHGFLRALEIWRNRREPALAGIGVGDDRGQRLVHLMRNRCRQLGKARRLARPRQALARQTKLFLRPDLTFDIQADHVPLHNCAFVVAHRCGAGLHPAIFSIEAPQTMPARIWLAS